MVNLKSPMLNGRFGSATDGRKKALWLGANQSADSLTSYVSKI
jgi:hypothetical protein